MKQSASRPLPARSNVCRYCNAKLSDEQSFAGDVCGNIQCQLQWRDDFNANEEKRKQELAEQERAFESRVRDYRDYLLERIEVPGGVVPAIGIVPANQREQMELPSARIEKFKTYLRQCIEEAYALSQNDNTLPECNPAETDSLINAESELERESLIQACSTCKGFCCLRGGATHAYQDTKNMLSYVRNHKDKDTDTILTEYLSYIPDVTYRDSCVYHTDAGCTLPREMRAEICNEHLCAGLKNLKNTFHEDKPEALFIVAENTHSIVRSSLVGKEIETLEFSRRK